MKISDLKKLKEFKAIAYFKGQFAYEDREDFIYQAICLFKDVYKEKFSEENLEINDSTISYKGFSRVFMMPKILRERIGVIKIRSKGDYTFTYFSTKENKEVTAYGQELRSENMTDDGFCVTTISGEQILYTIIKN